jgi:hypothetical protein
MISCPETPDLQSVLPAIEVAVLGVINNTGLLSSAAVGVGQVH